MPRQTCKSKSTSTCSISLLPGQGILTQSQQYSAPYTTSLEAQARATIKSARRATAPAHSFGTAKANERPIELVPEEAEAIEDQISDLFQDWEKARLGRRRRRLKSSPRTAREAKTATLAQRRALTAPHAQPLARRATACTHRFGTAKWTSVPITR
jgi:hypothetical protein